MCYILSGGLLKLLCKINEALCLSFILEHWNFRIQQENKRPDEEVDMVPRFLMYKQTSKEHRS